MFVMHMIQVDISLPQSKGGDEVAEALLLLLLSLLLLLRPSLPA